MGNQLLVFDGYCGFCTRAVEGIRRLDKRGLLTIVAWQEPGILENTGLSHEDVKSAAWFIEGFKRYRGAAAINRAISNALGFELPSQVYNLPGIRQLEDFIYAYIAANRSLFRGIQPYCRRQEVTCVK